MNKITACTESPALVPAAWSHGHVCSSDVQKALGALAPGWRGGCQVSAEGEVVPEESCSGCWAEGMTEPGLGGGRANSGLDREWPPLCPGESGWWQRLGGTVPPATTPSPLFHASLLLSKSGVLVSKDRLRQRVCLSRKIISWKETGKGRSGQVRRAGGQEGSETCGGKGCREGLRFAGLLPRARRAS